MNATRLIHLFLSQRDVSIDSLRLLTPEQALADTAHFINHIQTTVEGANRSPFILVGGHYSASLAVWFRQRYPHLALGKKKMPIKQATYSKLTKTKTL